MREVRVLWLLGCRWFGGRWERSRALWKRATSHVATSLAMPPPDASGVEALPGETDEQYVARQTRLREEAAERMRQKFGGSGGLTGGMRMGGVGSQPQQQSRTNRVGSWFDAIKTTVRDVATNAVDVIVGDVNEAKEDNVLQLKQVAEMQRQASKLAGGAAAPSSASGPSLSGFAQSAPQPAECSGAAYRGRRRLTSNACTPRRTSNACTQAFGNRLRGRGSLPKAVHD